ncbi:MAG: membrane integrity-associated transporter subunit PqiC [Rhodospirillaceae bacterium]|nr:membrane integrity-associated transporter subunit PqiC [Rhodospirillaceae bacterium]
MTVMNRRSLLLASAALALAGCSSDPVPVDTYYRLETTVSATRPGGPLKGIAEVMPIRGEGVVNGRAILFRRSETEIRPYSYHFWADTPASMLQRQLVDALRAGQAFDSVALPEMRLQRDYEIMGTLRKLEHDATQNRVIVEIEFSVRKVRNSEVQVLKVYKAEATARGDDVTGAVAGFSAALGQVFADLIADLGRIAP